MVTPPVGESAERRVTDHLGVVHACAHAIHAPYPYDHDDLVGVGMVALLVSARRYHTESPASFPTYAHYRIRGAMLDFCRIHDWGYSRHHGTRVAAKPSSLDATAARDPGAEPRVHDDHSRPDRAHRLGRLAVRDRFIALAFEAGYTQAEIAAMTGLTQGGVSHIRARKLHPACR